MSAATRVKICGLRTADAALVAAECGAHYLGFNFIEGVRRQLLPEEGREVLREYRSLLANGVTSNDPSVVGLFRNQDLDWVNDLAEELALDHVQLTGEEDEQYVRNMNRPVLRPVRVRPETTSEELAIAVQAELDAGRIALLDKYDAKLAGGTGVAFDWSVAEGIASRERVMLAGGLNPENVGDAIRQLHPWAVDVASGVETDGVKDPNKIRAFIEAVRSA